MKKKSYGNLAVLALCGLAVGGVRQADAAPECQVKVLRTVTDDLGNVWHLGKILPVTIERDDAHGGAFCASGGSCLPRDVNGTPALELLNCTVGPAIDDVDHRLVPSASLAGTREAAAMTARNNAEQKLSALGFSNASAGTLADTLTDRPHSRDGRLVARALAGSTTAVALLRRSYP